jgi:hypothetical protein
MATLEQIGAALKRAAAAGDTAAATKLASAYKAMQAQPASAPAKPKEAAPAPPQAGPMDFLSQGMSGVNEGIANTLGFPVEATSALLNLGSTGINKLTGAQIPMIEKPVGGVDTFRQMLSPTIREESADPALQMTRRVGQEVGAWAIPGIGMAGKAAKPAARLAREAVSAVGSGAGAAIAQQLAPDNPLMEFSGQMIGGITPGAAGRVLKGKPKIGTGNVDALRTAKDAAYKATDALGVAYSPKAYDDVLVGIAQEIKKAKISPDRHKAAYSVMKDLVAQRGKPMTLTELDQWRQIIRRDLITPSYTNKEMAADAEFGQMMLDKIDDFINSAAGKDVISGNAAEAAPAILKARDLNTRYRKAETLADALYKAKLQTEATGSGGNINNAIRQQLKSILTNPKRIKGFTHQERQMMESIVRGGKVENLMRLVGKLSPSGNGLMAALGIGGTALNPALAAAPLAGMAAKGMADNATLSKAAQLQELVASGKVRPLPRPMQVPLSVLVGQGANQMAQGR